VVELARLRDGRLVPLTVLDALGLVEERPRLAAPAALADAEDQLLAALRGRRTLLVLDNCEHLAEPVAMLVEALLAGCPGVRVLATSREPLRVPGEVRWPVPALPVPPPGPAEPERLAEFAGTRLFLERAAAAVPGFAVHNQAEASAVAEICRRLDGLPLAIELAAARAGALPPRELAARLDDRFRLLTAGARTALPRQQTLRAVVDWSWDLLDRSERAALRRLGVFMGGSTLEAAEAVCAGPELETAEVAGTISRLVDKSLVTVTPAATLPPLWWPGIEALELPPPPDAGGGVPRYGLLETVRAYALERLAEAGEADRVARAHAEWCVRLVEAAEPELRGHDQLVWIERVNAELDNLRAALRWLLDHGEAALAVRLMAGLGGFMLQNGHREEAARSLAAALALPGPTPDRARGLALLALAWADPDRASAETSRRRLAEARAALERAALSEGEMALAQVMSAIPEIVREGGEQAERTIDGALEEVERIGGWPAALIRLMRGFARASWSDRAGMREDGEVALERFRELGDRWGSVQSLELLSAVDMMEGRYGRASERLQEALRHAWDLRMAPEVVVQLCRLAHLAVLQDDLDLAEARAGAGAGGRTGAGRRHRGGHRAGGAGAGGAAPRRRAARPPLARAGHRAGAAERRAPPYGLHPARLARERGRAAGRPGRRDGDVQRGPRPGAGAPECRTVRAGPRRARGGRLRPGRRRAGGGAARQRRRGAPHRGRAAVAQGARGHRPDRRVRPPGARRGGLRPGLRPRRGAAAGGRRGAGRKALSIDNSDGITVTMAQALLGGRGGSELPDHQHPKALDTPVS
jgi:predicted ATPase